MTPFGKTFNSIFNDSWDWATPSPSYATPSVDIVEEDKKFIITTDLPGVAKKDISISAENGVLTIEAQRNVEQKNDDKNYRYYERHSGSYKRSFKLTDTLDAENIAAEYKNGVLTLSVPKKEKALARKIEIK